MLLTNTIIWTKVIHQKYMHPMIILDWIRSSHKDVNNVWKAMLHAYDINGDLDSMEDKKWFDL